MNKPMTEAEAREIFDAIINKTKNPELRDNRILLREYFCNPEFRRQMSDMTQAMVA